MKLHDKAIKALCTGLCHYTKSVPTGRIERTGKGLVETYRDAIKIDNQSRPMIAPFVDHSVNTNKDGKRIPSYGLSSFGYDIRLANEFKLFSRPNDGRVVDIMDFDETTFCEHIEQDHIVIPPGGFALARSVEYFTIPDNVLAKCENKSTWVRLGLFTLVTPLEPGWEGHLVVELANLTPFPIKVYAGVGVCQITFDAGSERPETTYGDRGGKYQGQTGVTGSKL